MLPPYKGVRNFLAGSLNSLPHNVQPIPIHINISKPEVLNPSCKWY